MWRRAGWLPRSGHRSRCRLLQLPPGCSARRRRWPPLRHRCSPPPHSPQQQLLLLLQQQQPAPAPCQPAPPPGGHPLPRRPAVPQTTRGGTLMCGMHAWAQCGKAVMRAACAVSRPTAHAAHCPRARPHAPHALCPPCFPRTSAAPSHTSEAGGRVGTPKGSSGEGTVVNASTAPARSPFQLPATASRIIVAAATSDGGT